MFKDANFRKNGGLAINFMHKKAAAESVSFIVQ